jgi:hypothetical protein
MMESAVFAFGMREMGSAHSNKSRARTVSPVRAYVSLEVVFVAVRATELQSLLAGLLKHSISNNSTAGAAPCVSSALK